MNYKKLITVIVVLFTQLFLIFVSAKNYNSYKQQVKLFADLNKADYSIAEPEFYNSIEIDLPNLTFTSIPLKALKAMYFLEHEPDSLNYVKSLLKKSIKDNPFLKYSEGNLSQIYYAQKKYDSAYYFARIAFNNLPKNAVHFAMISKLFANQNKIDSIIYAFDKINKRPLVDINRIFFASMNNFYIELKDSLKEEVLLKAKKAKSHFKTDKDLQLLVDNIIYTKDSVLLAESFEQFGRKALSEGRMIEGIEYFEKALKIRENNISFIQTLGLAYYNLNQFEKAIEYLRILENNSVKLDPLSLYVMGISHYNTQKFVTGCDYLEKSMKFGQKDAEIAYLKYCKN